MEDIGKNNDAALPQLRIILIGERWSGKSYSGNTILGKERFECGRTRTAQAELRHEVVNGRNLVVVDVPGWSSPVSLNDIPEKDKQEFKLSVSRCPPGPHAFLLIVPIDSAFTKDQRMPLEQHMKLMGERVWKHTLVLFTCGDYLGGKTIEQHIENEGEALEWLVERCGNRYHVFNNKNKSDGLQVTCLLEKIDAMILWNKGEYYQMDERILMNVKEKQKEDIARAKERRRKAQEQRKQIKALIPELRIVLLGSRRVGKTSLGNTLLGIKEQNDGFRTVHSVVRKGYVDNTTISLVDTPGWWKGFSVCDTTQAMKEEVMCSIFLCPPGPHVFLLVIDADASFNAKHRDAVTQHLELLGEDVWRHTMVVFTRGDWLGKKTIEEYIEGEGEPLSSVVDKCHNRYHVIDNKNTGDGTQVTEMLEKIRQIVVENEGSHILQDEQISRHFREKAKYIEEKAKLRQANVNTRSISLKASGKPLQEITVIMLGQKTSGKSTAGNTLLHSKVFPTYANEKCLQHAQNVAGRRVTVIDTPGWVKISPKSTKEMDRKIVQGFSLCPKGVHAVLLVIPLDMAFTEEQQNSLEEHMDLFDAGVWKHTLILFTYGDSLREGSIEEYIEREANTLPGLVEKCENRYHVLNNMEKTDITQVTNLLEKIEEMVADSNGQLFCPDMGDVERRMEKFEQNKMKKVLKHRLASVYRRRELELMTGFRKILMDLQLEIKKEEKNTKSKLCVVELPKIKAKDIQKKKMDEGKEREGRVHERISLEIEKLNQNIMKSSDLHSHSLDILIPSMSGGSPAPSMADSISGLDKVLTWMCSLDISKNVETFNSKATSGYESVQSIDYSVDEDN